MPGVIPFIPLIAAGVGIAATNAQSKAANKNQQNAYNQAQGDVAGAGTSARSNLDALFAAHPNPANSLTPVSAPGRTGPAAVGGGTVDAKGNWTGQASQAPPQQAQQDPAAMLALLMPLLQQMLGQGAASQGDPANGSSRATQPVNRQAPGSNPAVTAASGLLGAPGNGDLSTTIAPWLRKALAPFGPTAA